MHKSDMLSLSEINAVRLSQCICLGKNYIRQWTSGPQGNPMCGDWRARGHGSYHPVDIL